MRRYILPAAALLTIGFGGASGAAETVLHRPIDAEPETLDPQMTTSADDIAIDYDLFEPLVGRDAELHLVPGAAQSWDVSPDGLTYRFHLRPDGRWSNGDPVTAGDFVYALQRLVTPATGAADIAPVRQIVDADEINAGREKDPAKLGVRAVDPLTLEIRLVRRQVALPTMLAGIYGIPLNHAAMQAAGKDWTRPGKLVSNGPYVLDGWVPNAQLVARRNPYFHDRDTVKIDRVEYDVTDDPETGLKRYLTGDLDWVLLPPKEIPRMRAERAAEFHSGPWLSVSFISFNVRKGLFADHPKLREALSLAVDREVIAAKVDPRGQQPAYSFVPPAVTGWAPQPYDWRDRPMAERIARARSLLAEEGYDAAHPLHVTISYSTGEEQRKVLLAVAAMWKSGLGVETTLANQEWRSLIATLEQWDFEISAYGRSNSTNDPGLFLEPFLSTAGENSDTGYANPAFDALMNQGDQAATEGERFVLLEKAEALMLADYPLIPTFFGAINRLVSPRVSGLPDGIGYPQTRYIRISAP